MYLDVGHQHYGLPVASSYNPARINIKATRFGKKSTNLEKFLQQSVIPQEERER